MKRPPRLLYDPRMGGSGVGGRRTQKGRHNDTLMATKPPPPPEITWVPGSPQSFNLELGWVQAFAGATCVLDLSMHTVPRWGASWTEVYVCLPFCVSLSPPLPLSLSLSLALPTHTLTHSLTRFTSLAIQCRALSDPRYVWLLLLLLLA